MTGPQRVRVGMLALALAGCSTDAEPVPQACASDTAVIVTALGRAPGPVTLADRTRISTCVSRARTTQELQTLGLTLTRVADDLAGRGAGDMEAATALGYLTGAVDRGADSSPGGVALQLAERVQRAAGRIELPAAQAAIRRGRQAGRRSG